MENAVMLQLENVQGGRSYKLQNVPVKNKCNPIEQGCLRAVETYYRWAIPAMRRRTY